MANLKDVVFFLAKDGTTSLMLDVTSQMEVTRNASTTMHTLQDGVKVSDHYHPDLPMVSIVGTINATKIRNETQTPERYIKLINEAMDSALVFTLYGTEDGAIPSFDNCVITSFNYIKEGKDSLDVNLQVQQLDFGMKVTQDSFAVVNVNPNTTSASTLAGETDSKTGSKTLLDGHRTTQKVAEIIKETGGFKG
jgi:hypothetical protein